MTIKTKTQTNRHSHDKQQIKQTNQGWNTMQLDCQAELIAFVLSLLAGLLVCLCDGACVNLLVRVIAFVFV